MTEHTPTRVTSVEQLNALLKKGEHEFCISYGILRSSKGIWRTNGGRYQIHNEIDDTEQTLTAAELFTESNIGAAIKGKKGSFWCY